ncbi:MAG: hypothetical protein AAGF98_17265, partial [Cyanobacteria bacterium P01_H01_bin.153]
MQNVIYKMWGRRLPPIGRGVGSIFSISPGRQGPHSQKYSSNKLQNRLHATVISEQKPKQTNFKQKKIAPVVKKDEQIITSKKER